MFGFLPGASSCRRCVDTETYRAHFCGLSNRLSHDYGLWSRWLINRDSAFVALLGSAQQQQAPECSLGTCCNPWVTPYPLHQQGTMVSYAAAVTLCGLSAKLDDEVDDERGLRRSLAKGLRAALSEPIGLAIELLHGLQFPVNQVRAALSGQGANEHPNATWTDAAEATAAAYEAILSHTAELAQQPSNIPLLARLGRALGRLIYAEDAWSDQAKDQRLGRFNLFLLGRGQEFVTFVQSELAILRELFQLLHLQRHESLLESILVQGSTDRMAPALRSQGVMIDEDEEKKPDTCLRIRDRCDRCCWGCGNHRCWNGCDCGNGPSGCDCCDSGGCDGCESCDCGGCDCSC
jgi:hypothetical protein